MSGAQLGRDVGAPPVLERQVGRGPGGQVPAACFTHAAGRCQIVRMALMSDDTADGQDDIIDDVRANRRLLHQAIEESPGAQYGP
jgi:hypothetical protein